MRTILSSVFAAAICGTAWAAPTPSPTNDLPAFQNLSIKPSPTDGFAASVKESEDGGPGTEYPTRIEYHHIRLAMLLVRAYGVRYCDISGPEWIFDERYEISGNVPPGVTDEQFRLMLRAMLAKQFKLQAHYETGETPAYTLAVAESGVRFREHLFTAVNWVSRSTVGMPFETSEGKGRLKGEDQEIGSLSRALSLQLNLPVIDHTGLTGRYDFALHWTTAYPRVLPINGPDTDLVESVEEQLGLKLEKSKIPVQVLLIDNVERVPSGS
jgi:uncharacterized protein (TIGR03435 family)